MSIICLLCQGFKISDKVSFYHFEWFFSPIFHRVSQCQQLLMSLGTDGLWEDCWVRYSASWSQDCTVAVGKVTEMTTGIKEVAN